MLRVIIFASNIVGYGDAAIKCNNTVYAYTPRLAALPSTPHVRRANLDHCNANGV